MPYFLLHKMILPTVCTNDSCAEMGAVVSSYLWFAMLWISCKASKKFFLIDDYNIMLVQIYKYKS